MLLAYGCMEYVKAASGRNGTAYYIDAVMGLFYKGSRSQQEPKGQTALCAQTFLCVYCGSMGYSAVYYTTPPRSARQKQTV